MDALEDITASPQQQPHPPLPTLENEEEDGEDGVLSSKEDR